MNKELSFPSYIDNREWRLHNHPFPHYRVQNVFHLNFLEKLDSQFQEILDRGLSELHCLQRFKRFDEDTYDAYSYVLPPNVNAPFNLFYSEEWLQFMRTLFPELVFTTDISSSCHHHRVGSNSGFVHSDFTTTQFLDNTLNNGINPWYFHKTANCPDSSSLNDTDVIKKTRVMRTVMSILYINNPEWKEDDGGETGLYQSREDKVPTRLIPPISNSILTFEITPRTYHAFRYNKVWERNCIVQCFHSDVDYKLNRHPGYEPVYNDF